MIHSFIVTLSGPLGASDLSADIYLCLLTGLWIVFSTRIRARGRLIKRSRTEALHTSPSNFINVTHLNLLNWPRLDSFNYRM